MRGLCCLTIIAKALDSAFSRTGRLKVGERELGQDHTPAISKKDYDPRDPTKAASNGHARDGRHRLGASFLPLWLQDGFELVFTFRGVGWDFGRGVRMPPERRPLDRKPFLLATLHSFLASFLLMDLLESCLKLVPGVGSTTGGTIFLPFLPPPQRYLASTAIHFVTGFGVLAGFQMCYDLATLVGVGLLGHVPASWPPVQDAPWRSTSLTELWAKRWHQLLRRTFLVLGGVVALGSSRVIGRDAGPRSHPGKMVFRVVSVLLTFIASGAFHEVSATLSMGRGTDLRGFLFFALQGPLVILEGIWAAVTGHPVGGWVGQLWVWAVVGGFGQQLSTYLTRFIFTSPVPFRKKGG